MSHTLAKNIKLSVNKSLSNRIEIIAWINKLLEINLEKVEQLATGEIYCKLFYLLFPTSVKPSKIKLTISKNQQFNQECYSAFKIF